MLKKFTQILFLSLLLFVNISYSQVKICTYNLLDYPGTDSTIRNPYFRTVISSINPDILVVQEMTSQGGVNGFLNGVMNYNGNVYSAGVFIDGPDTDNEIYYKTSMFVFLSNTPIQTDLRNISEFKIVHIATHDTLRIYSVHLKASEGSSNELARAAEVDSLRKKTNALHPNSYFIVCGDFNIYGSTESAYQKLLQVNTGNDGNFNDPYTMTGTWNNSAYAHYHTQSTRVRSFGGGSTGGLDDRFDMILYSNGIKNPGGITYVANSTTPYGNDGNHYNDSINKPPNGVVSQTIANAIHYASDHAPVYALFTFEPVNTVYQVSSEVPQDFALYQNFPNPFNPVTKIKYDILKNSEVSIKVYDVSGKEIYTLVSEFQSPGTYEKIWDASGFASGIYFYELSVDNKITDVKKMIVIK